VFTADPSASRPPTDPDPTGPSSALSAHLLGIESRLASDISRLAGSLSRGRIMNAKGSPWIAMDRHGWPWIPKDQRQSSHPPPPPFFLDPGGWNQQRKQLKITTQSGNDGDPARISGNPAGSPHGNCSPPSPIKLETKKITNKRISKNP